METESLVMDAEEQAMRDLGHETDVNQGRPVEEAKPEPQETPAPAEPETPEPTLPAEPAEPEIQPAAETETPEQKLGRDIKTGQFTKQQKPETEYSKAQKEAARKERSWQALQAEKEQFRMMQTQWEEQNRMAQLEATRKNYQPLQKEGLTAQQYMEGAQRFLQEGDFENAYKAREVADQLFHAEQGRVQQMQSVEAEYQWRMGMQQAIQMRPDIGDANSPIAQHLERIISQNPWIYHIPNGFLRAAEVADMLTRMSEIKEKEDEIIKLRADLERFQKKSQPGKSGFASPSLGEKDFDDMSLDEMEAHLKGVTAEADNYR